MLNTIKETTYAAISCFKAAIDTLSDSETKLAIEAREHDMREIRKQYEEETLKLFLEYKEKLFQCNKAYKLAKKEANNSFNGTISAIFGYYLNKHKQENKNYATRGKNAISQ